MNTRPVTKTEVNQTQQGLNFQDPKKVLDFFVLTRNALLGFLF